MKYNSGNKTKKKQNNNNNNKKTTKKTNKKTGKSDRNDKCFYHINPARAM